jgi:hypothetical protein
MKDNPWMMLALGVISGGAITWLVARHFYQRQLRDSQKMTVSLAESVAAKLSERNLVAPVLEALREAGLTKTSVPAPAAPSRQAVVAGGNSFVRALTEVLLKADASRQSSTSDRTKALRDVKFPREHIGPGGQIETD